MADRPQENVSNVFITLRGGNDDVRQDLARHIETLARKAAKKHGFRIDVAQDSEQDSA